METSWGQIRGAADGDHERGAEFVARYRPWLVAFFRDRWRGWASHHEVEDAVQEVFLDCFRPAGALARARAGEQAGFRGYLHGVARIVALRRERARHESAARRAGPDRRSETKIDPAPSPSRALDRAFALSLVQEAVRLNRERAASSDAEAFRRVEILRLRFAEGLPIREIADRLGLDVVAAHRAYARARREFRRVLLELVAERCTGSRTDAARDCVALVQLLER